MFRASSHLLYVPTFTVKKSFHYSWLSYNQRSILQDSEQLEPTTSSEASTSTTFNNYKEMIISITSQMLNKYNPIICSRDLKLKFVWIREIVLVFGNWSTKQKD